MARGGARTRSGPPADPYALRRDRDSKEWIDLPAAREGAIPKWPLSKATAREIELWAGEWTRPQAVMWEQNHQDLEVALYVRSLRQAESPNAAVALRTLVKQHMDALGLTIPGMKAHRWRITGDDIEPKRRNRPANSSSVKERLKLVEGGGSST